MTDFPVAAFVAGVGVGLAVAIPIGPMGIMCIQRTLRFGLTAGLATGLAAATVQGAYSIVIVLGLGTTATALVSAATGVLSFLSASVLLWFAFDVMTRRMDATGSLATDRRPGLKGSYREALALGFANPLTIFLFAAALPAVASPGTLADAPGLVLGVVLGAIGWYAVLSGTVALLRERIPVRALRLVDQLSGAALAFLGFAMTAKAFAAMSI